MEKMVISRLRRHRLMAHITKQQARKTLAQYGRLGLAVQVVIWAQPDKGDPGHTSQI